MDTDDETGDRASDEPTIVVASGEISIDAPPESRDVPRDPPSLQCIDRRHDLVTRPFDPRELAIAGPPSWALVTASLERAAPTWGPLAIRLGALALLIECCHAMAQPGAPKSLVARAQEILEAINRMHWER